MAFDPYQGLYGVFWGGGRACPSIEDYLRVTVRRSHAPEQGFRGAMRVYTYIHTHITGVSSWKTMFLWAT